MNIKKFIIDISKKLGFYYPLYYNIRNKSIITKFQELYKNFVDKDDIAFDIGANIGNRTESLSRICKKVIAADPLPLAYNEMRMRFRFNKKVTVLPLAVGEKEGIMNLYVGSSHVMSSMSEEFIKNVSEEWNLNIKWNETIKVKTTTLDELIKKYGIPSFIKIDVEGFELNVLMGLSYQIKNLCFEYNPTYLEPTYKCIDYLSSLGNYKFNISIEETAQLKLPEFIDAKTFIELLNNNIHEGKFGDIYAKLM